MATIADLIEEGTERLMNAGIPDPERTARTILSFALGLDSAAIHAHPERIVPPRDVDLALTLIDRRSGGEPFQYITGRQEFFGLEFLVSPAALIPRPETEFLVEETLRLAREQPRTSRLTIADIGTGSGCIAVALALNLPTARIIASDLSPAALDLARQNANRHGLSSRIEFLEGDLLDPLEALDLERRVNLIASNPPYVPRNTAGALQREVRDWEPEIALFGGANGLEIFSRLLSQAHRYLSDDGRLVVEIGFAQLEAALEICESGGWEPDAIIDDLQGIPRALNLRRTG